MAALEVIDVDEGPDSGSRCAPITVGCANPNPIEAPWREEAALRSPVTELAPPLGPPYRGEEELWMETEAAEPEPSSPRPRGMPGGGGRESRG